MTSASAGLFERNGAIALTLRAFPANSYPLLRIGPKEKIVSARRRNQHARRVRYPDGLFILPP